MELSVIIPVYNAEATIEKLLDKLFLELSDLEFEVILVNDSSRDSSEVVCERLATNRSNLTFVSLRKNFGEHNAVMCGLNFCKGDFVVIIDDDFQNPPSEILKLLDEIKKGYDVVYSRYAKKRHHLLRNLGSALNDRVANVLIDKPKDLYLSSFKMIRRELVQEIIKYQGPFPYIDGLILRCTNSFSSVLVRHDQREDGRSGYTFKKLVSLYLNMFINFSIVPLRVFTVIGIVLVFLGTVLAAVVVVERIGNPDLRPGWATTTILILITSGFQTVFLGLIGEYLGKQYLDQNKTPQWVVKKVVSKKTSGQ
jgi:glycosyltransferase involved in cell wall biosynthesis